MSDTNPNLFDWPPFIRKGAPYARIPYIDDNNDIFIWFQTPDKKFIKSKITSILNGPYYAKDKKDENDTFIDFIDFAVQKSEFLYGIKTISKMQDDFENILISLAKIDFFTKTEENIENSTYLVKTDIEYLLIVCRSLFDLYQEMLISMFSRIKFIDHSNGSLYQVHSLPKTFSKMCLNNNIAITEEELISKYKLPIPFAKFYYENAIGFSIIRLLRDNIVHRGFDIPTIFRVPEYGFGISYNGDDNFTRSIKTLNIIQESSLKATKIAPLLPIISYIVKNTIDVSSKFTDLIRTNISKLPEDTAPGYKIFMRSNFSKYFNLLDSVIAENKWSF